MPKIGMKFDTVKEIYECYRHNGQLRHVTFTCILEGKNKRVLDASVVLNTPDASRLEPDDKWRISVLILKHNHQNIRIEARYWRYNKVINNPLYHTIAVEDIPEIFSEQSPQGTFSLIRCDIGGAQFYKFDNDKSHEKFHPGQVWESYCKLDDMPKYYVEISRVELFPDFKLYAKWLEPCAPPREVIKWLDEKMLVSFERLKISVNKQSLYEIYPKKGEVWATYMNFNSDWTCNDLENCECDVVEVLEVYDVPFFKAIREAWHDYIMGIPWIDLFRFSHQLPAL
ncbi:hypothetical protein MKW92_001537 [Papaver armeniacum]|nr:hypothetical protein MKW92_001537 [Papaver armeniacum]